jgi:hypothetical protein
MDCDHCPAIGGHNSTDPVRICPTPNHCDSYWEIKLDKNVILPHTIHRERQIKIREEQRIKTGWFSHKIIPAQYFTETEQL